MADSGDGYIRFRCKACGKRLKVRAAGEGGQIASCPKCGATVNVPLLGERAQQAGVLLKEEDPLAQAPPSQAARRASASASRLRRTGPRHLAELEAFCSAVERVDAEMVEWVQRLARTPEADPEGAAAEVERIGRRRADEIRELADRYRAAWQEKFRRLQDGPAAANAPLIEDVRWSLALLGPYVRHVLRVGPED
jgi:hypothetical protein